MKVIHNKALIFFLALALGCGTFAGNPEEDDDDTKEDPSGELVYDEVEEPVIPPKETTAPKPSEEGVNVYLVDAPIDGLESVFVTIEALEVKQAAGSWERLEVAGASGVDLLTLQGEASRVLGSFSDLAPGVYTELRLILSDEYPPYAKTTDGSLIGFKIASGASSGIKIKGQFEYEETQKNIVLDFDLRQSITQHGNSAKPKYRMAPVIKLFDKNELGQVQGESPGNGVVCLYPEDVTPDPSDQCALATKSMKTKTGPFVMGYVEAGGYTIRVYGSDGAILTDEKITIQAGLTTDLTGIN
jgi:hypothetical protein